MFKWDAELAVDLIEREQVTAVAGVPTTVFQLLEVAEHPVEVGEPFEARGSHLQCPVCEKKWPAGVSGRPFRLSSCS